MGSTPEEFAARRAYFKATDDAIKASSNRTFQMEHNQFSAMVSNFE